MLGWDSARLQEGFNGPEPQTRSRWTTGQVMVLTRTPAAFEIPEVASSPAAHVL